MPTLPVRDLGAIGTITDKSPYVLPLNAFSKSFNVLFDEGRAQRAPAFKSLYEQMRQIQPYSAETHTYNNIPGTYENTQGAQAVQQRFIGSYDTSTAEAVIVCDKDGTVREYPNGNLKLVPPTNGSLVTNSNQWTHAQVAGISMLARKGMLPYVRNLQTDTAYSYMGTNWPSNYQASLIRGFGDYFIAMVINKAGTDYPTMVKWCHPLQFSQATGTVRWDPTDTTSLAGENILGEMRTPIRDGLTLGNSFMIYSHDQVWSMELTQSSQVFNFRKIFQTGGVIAANCCCEVDGVHYVFGEDDIYKHDGVTRKSVADERVRKYVYSTMNRDSKDSFFVHHDSLLNLIYFCYVSKDAVAFPGTAYCNVAAVYNYRADTWGFLDIPNVCGATETNLSLYQAGYGSSSTADTPKISVMLGVYDAANKLTESRVYAVDTPSIGFVYLQPHKETIKTAILERVGIDLDKEANFELRSYKQIKAILPQVVFESNQGQLQFQIGASDQIDGPINWQPAVPFDQINDYKVDTRAAGRYLAIRVLSNTVDFFRFPAYDVEVVKLAKR